MRPRSFLGVFSASKGATCSLRIVRFKLGVLTHQSDPFVVMIPRKVAESFDAIGQIQKAWWGPRLQMWDPTSGEVAQQGSLGVFRCEESRHAWGRVVKCVEICYMKVL